jgi:hypothetical protein
MGVVRFIRISRVIRVVRFIRFIRRSNAVRVSVIGFV